MKTLFNFFFLAFILNGMIACSDSDNPITPSINDEVDPESTPLYGLGAFQDESNDNIPTGIYFGNGSLPSTYDISNWLPPIGDQGQYGTCVAWALGYNLKTMIEAQDMNLSASDLAQQSNQFSPKDLFLAIPNDQTGSSCSGTYLYSAFDVMQSRGIAKESTEPYTNLSDCSQPTSSMADSEAGSYKISSYRRVDHDVTSIKQQIASDKPVGFGARLSDVFMFYNSDQVITGHTTFDRVGQHAGHAMTIVGYDDNKGPNGAFRIVNSWGESWGDRGYLWVDYNFFVSSDFLSVAYTAINQPRQIDPTDPTNPTTSEDVDLIPYNLYDQADPSSPTLRNLSYNVYNNGSGTAKATSDWTVSYLYYNAFDASDYGIILHDYYSDDFGQPGQNGDMGSGPGFSGNWFNHVDVPGGTTITQAVTGGNDNFSWSYELPNLTGHYYLVMIADTYDVLSDVNKDNNYFYMTDEWGWPIYFENGRTTNLHNDKPTNQVRSAKADVSRLAPPQRHEALKNAYTKEEIGQMLKAMKTNGKLQIAISKYKRESM